MQRHLLARTPMGVRDLFRHALTIAGLAVVFSACQRDNPINDPSSVAADGGATGEPGMPEALEVTHWGRAGIGHTSNIDRVALSSDGTAAITRDQIGGVRLWPALDGSMEPIALPIRGPTQMSVERHAKGFTVAAVDSANGAKIYDIDRKGVVTERGALPPFKPLFDIDVLPDGEHCVALFRDHTIRIVERDGTEVHRFEQKMFRPTSLRVATDGSMVLALLAKPGAAAPIEVQPLRLVAGTDSSPPSLERATDKPIPVAAGTAVTEATSVLSPDGKQLAVVDKVVGGEWELTIVDLKAGDKTTRVKVPIPSHIVPTLGFIGPRKLLVSANDGGLSWEVDVEDGGRYPRVSAPQDFINQGRAYAVRAGVQAVGYGSWLYVHDTAEHSQQFIGYRSFQTQSASVSPSGERVAWAFLSGSVFVESLGGETGERVEIRSPDGTAPSKIRFVDDEHLVIVDMSGGIRLVRWRDGTTVDETGIQGAIRALHFDHERGLMLIERHTNDVNLFEVADGELRGPYIVADQAFRSGLLRAQPTADATAESNDDEAPVLWTLDGANLMRHYTLSELRSDLEQSDVMAKGTPLESGKVAPMAIDSRGRAYGVRWNGSAMEVFVDHGKRIEAQVAPAGDISLIVPSTNGESFVAVHQRGQNTSISVHDTETLQERWSYSSGVFSNEMVWSADGKFLAIAGNAGAVVLDAKTGEPIAQRCGMKFEKVGAPPPTAFNTINIRSTCEG